MNLSDLNIGDTVEHGSSGLAVQVRKIDGERIDHNLPSVLVRTRNGQEFWVYPEQLKGTLS